ncbi:MAG: hypothetical protein A3C53_03220 [Omnitrophica WOR_2 bacterium RIFCSPHIGHO2_02_FULL_68_15]|nr:MAG: hypothetical protein A3C53_03220 [Omnitrophica WOR_2 bacterium RIFCSPHIGHO2_02_FULL_68_15]
MMRIAIAIPAYNSRRTIVETLESLQKQGPPLDAVEAVWLADDGSEDGTVAAARQAWKASVPLRVLEGEAHVGQGRNSNRVMMAVGELVEWVLFLHADDVVKPSWLSTMMSQIQHCGPSVASICSSWDSLQPDGAVMAGEEAPQRPVETIGPSPRTIRDTLWKGCWWHISGCAIRRRAFWDVGGLDPAFTYNGDFEILLRWFAHGWSVRYVPRSLIAYRQHEASVSSSAFRSDEDIRQSLQVTQRYAAPLPWSLLAALHARNGLFAARRIGRAFLQGRLRRGLLSVRTLWMVGVSAVQCARRGR